MLDDKIDRFLHVRRQIFVGRFYWQTKSAHFFDRLTFPLLSAVATTVLFALVRSFFLSTHVPLHQVQWNFARTCISATSGSLLNVKVIDRRSRLHAFLCFLCVDDTAATRACALTISRILLNFKVIGQSWRSRGFSPFFYLRDTASAHGQYLALSKDWRSCLNGYKMCTDVHGKCRRHSLDP